MISFSGYENENDETKQGIYLGIEIQQIGCTIAFSKVVFKLHYEMAKTWVIL